MSSVIGYLPEIFSAYCDTCKVKTVPDTGRQLYCEHCSKPLMIHMRVNEEIESTYIVKPIRVNEMLAQSHVYSRNTHKEYYYDEQWSKVFSVQPDQYKADKIAVSVQYVRLIPCDPDDIFLEKQKLWTNNW